MKGTVLVTGATGFIGRHLVRHLANTGWRVIAAARSSAMIETGPGITALALPDLGKKVHWAPLLAGVTHAVHLAGLPPHAGEVDEAVYIAVNADAAGDLAEAARARRLHRMVLVSSVMAQTGTASTKVIREDDPPRPVSAYGRSKLAGEQRVSEKLAGSATEYVHLRPVLVYGPGATGNMGSLVKIARSSAPLPLGSLRTRRSLVSVGNLCSAISHALVEPRCAGRTFIVSDPEPITVPEMLSALRAGLGKPARVFKFPAPLLATLAFISGRGEIWDRLATDLVVDTRALRSTGWTPTEQTRDALAAAIRSEGT